MGLEYEAFDILRKKLGEEERRIFIDFLDSCMDERIEKSKNSLLTRKEAQGFFIWSTSVIGLLIGGVITIILYLDNLNRQDIKELKKEFVDFKASTNKQFSELREDMNKAREDINQKFFDIKLFFEKNSK